MKIIAFLIALLISNTSYAEIATDKAAGNCAAHMAVRQKEAGARAALQMADNQTRALKFADLKMNQIAKYKDDKNMMQSIVYSTSTDCTSIGLRPADY